MGARNWSRLKTATESRRELRLTGDVTGDGLHVLESVQKNWKRVKGFHLLAFVVNNVKFKDGEQVQDQSDRNAA
jgi:hypothetical protein